MNFFASKSKISMLPIKVSQKRIKTQKIYILGLLKIHQHMGSGYNFSSGDTQQANIKDSSTNCCRPINVINFHEFP